MNSVFLLTWQTLLHTEREGLTMNPDWPGTHCASQAAAKLVESLNSNRDFEFWDYWYIHCIETNDFELEVEGVG